jgi:hypothetical protein
MAKARVKDQDKGGPSDREAYPPNPLPLAPAEDRGSLLGVMGEFLPRLFAAAADDNVGVVVRVEPSLNQSSGFGIEIELEGASFDRRDD